MRRTVGCGRSPFLSMFSQYAQRVNFFHDNKKVLKIPPKIEPPISNYKGESNLKVWYAKSSKRNSMNKRIRQGMRCWTTNLDGCLSAGHWALTDGK